MDYHTFLNNSSSAQTIYYNPYCTTDLYNLPSPTPTSTQPYANRFVYINQNFVNPAPPKSILINPNFKKTVHINPNFKANAPTSTKIHVNPDVLKLGQKKEAETKPTKLVSTRTKLIRVSEKSASHNDSKRKRRRSVHTTYKIVRSGKCETPKGAEVSVQRLNYTKTKFKIDKLVSPSKFKYCRTASKNAIKQRSPTTKYLSINGVLYKRTPNVLKKAKLNESNGNAAKRNKILRIGANLYKLDSNRKTLRRVDLNSSKINVRRLSASNIYVKSNVARKLPSQVKHKQISPSKLRKCNLPCPIYRKLGKCRGKENGTCIRIHNPNQITLCTRFLQGACIDKSCLLSHKVSPEKMPTCKYFLEGLCSKEDCPYLHVKISPKAPICKDFLEGFCKKAKECDKRHQFLCPDFEKSGSCVRKRCPYPHGKMVRELITARSKVAKRVVKSTKMANAEIPLPEQGEINQRYYKGKDGVENSDKTGKGVETKNEIISGNRSRPKLGRLPSFIAIG